MTTVTLIDNYDSFTWNLWHYFGQLGCEVTVHRNDAVASQDVIAAGPDAIVLSPGPCTPNEAGICCDLIERTQGRIPMFGVCLGHQAIGQAMGGDVIRAPLPMHGKLSDIHHEGGGVFRGLNGPFKATRYHSLIVDRSTIPDELSITAETESGLVMGLSHKSAPIHGVQFHPEINSVRPRAPHPTEFLGPSGGVEWPAWTIVMDAFKPFVGLAAANSLSREQSAEAFDLLLSGEATPAQIGGFLMALRVRGETPEEIAGAVSAMRSKMTRVAAPVDAIDIVGTGGDQSGSYNVSTAAALIVAGAGVKVAKHGNRALSSRSGAADVLAALGVKIDLAPAAISLCIEEAGIGFMFAPAHHGAMKHVGPARVELGTRTIFNLIGPCSNPAGVKRQLLGVFSERWLEPLAQVLGALGSERVLAVHGSDGLDEITTTGPTQAVLMEKGTLTRFTIDPAEIGVDRVSAEELKGGDGEHNAKALMAVLSGERTPYRDIAVLNAAAALMVAGKATTLSAGAQIAATSIEHGRAEAALQRLVAVSNG